MKITETVEITIDILKHLSRCSDSELTDIVSYINNEFETRRINRLPRPKYDTNPCMKTERGCINNTYVYNEEADKWEFGCDIGVKPVKLCDKYEQELPF